MNKFVAAIFILVSLAAFSQNTVYEEETQTELRLNPEIEDNSGSERVDYSHYPFLRLQHNKISLNGADWDALRDKFRAAKDGDGRFNVVYLGDSHIQADFGGDVLRRRLTAASRYGGRGLIIPFRLAGTNQPNDYSITMTAPYTSSKLMRTPWATEMPFTGVGLQPQSHRFTIGLSSPARTGRLRMHTRGGSLSPLAVTADGIDVGFTSAIDDDGLVNIEVIDPAKSFTIQFEGDKKAVIGGIELISDTVGTTVHSIGNNGATFSAYATTDRFGSELAALSPDLVIIALGTNEAFGRTSAATLQNDIDVLLSTIRSHSPGAQILLVGPTECYRRVYRRRRGRRKSSATVVNTKTADMARAIRQYAEREGVAYYNHYAVAGSAPSMRQAKILSRDGVHFTATGYRLWGNLLGDAVLKELER